MTKNRKNRSNSSVAVADVDTTSAVNNETMGTKTQSSENWTSVDTSVEGDATLELESHPVLGDDEPTFPGDPINPELTETIVINETEVGQTDVIVGNLELIPGASAPSVSTPTPAAPVPAGRKRRTSKPGRPYYAAQVLKANGGLKAEINDELAVKVDVASGKPNKTESLAWLKIALQICAGWEAAGKEEKAEEAEAEAAAG